MSAAYTVDSVDGGARNLCDLINVICVLQFELGTDEKDHRIGSLLWIARDLADGLVECHEREVAEAAGRRVNGTAGGEVSQQMEGQSI